MPEAGHQGLGHGLSPCPELRRHTGVGPGVRAQWRASRMRLAQTPRTDAVW
jgi:hypothetical protein